VLSAKESAAGIARAAWHGGWDGAIAPKAACLARALAASAQGGDVAALAPLFTSLADEAARYARHPVP